MKINALDIERYLRMRNGWDAAAAGKETEELIIRLADILDRLEPQGDDNQHTIWVKVKRPTFKQFYSEYFGYDSEYEDEEMFDFDIAKEEYVKEYPDTKVWYRLFLKHFTQKDGKEFYAFFINDSYIFSVNELEEKYPIENIDLLHWAVGEAEAFVESVKNGKVYEEILNKISYRYRTGYIKRNSIWEADPEIKDDFFSEYDIKEVSDFKFLFKDGTCENEPFEEMTVRKYYEACSIVYEAIGKHKKTAEWKYTESEMEKKHYGYPLQTPKEQYYAVADGRDDGLSKVPMDDPFAFEKWLNKKGPYYEFSGHHPWEIIPSFSTSLSMHLSPVKDQNGKWKLYLSGESEARAPQTVIAANALAKSGYPLKVCGYAKILERLEGNDDIKVVPYGDTGFIEGCIHLEDESDRKKEIIKKVIWKFDEYKVKYN